MNTIWNSLKNLFKGKEQNLSKKIPIFLMIIVFVVGTSVGLLQMKPPAVPSESDTDYPAYKRMLDNLKDMTVVPHPSGSKELESVRAHILAQIREMGLEPIVETEVYTIEDIKSGLGAEPSEENEMEDQIRNEAHFNKNDELILKNILVKLDAPNTDRAVLMMAHYDTEKGTPGAGDDMISVCALLEAMREQSKNTNLKNDIYFLFCDGEELGAFGSKAFVKSHPKLKESIDLVINVEGRGNRGGVIMFESSAYNYDLMRYFKLASSRPLAFSFTSSLYRKMPNTTDMTSFLDAGYSGLNFTVAEGVENYGAMSDNYENFNPRTAYNYLRTVREMADYSAKEQFQGNSSKQDGVYFPFLPGHLVLMSNTVAYILSGFVVLAALLWLILQIRHGRVRISGIAISTGRLIEIMAVMTLLSWCIVTLTTQIMHLSESSNTETLFLCQTLVLTVGTLTISFFRMRKQSLTEALAGLLPLLLLLIIGTTVFFISISYLFTLSTLGLLLVAILEKYNIGRLIATTILGVGILLLYVPVCWLIYVAFMLPITPVVIALSVLPVSIIAAFFATKYVTSR
ncbi:M20/M25/M40 family metallo-hydrolase [Clostridium sp. Marseille-QA1073]